MIKENVRRLLRELPEDVTLLAAAKERSADEISEAVKAGITIIGENYLQDTLKVINKVEDKKLKFTALGNLIPAAKRIAEASDEKVLLVKEAYERAGSEIKAIEVNKGGVYEAKRVVDRDKNQAFIKNFLKRIEEEEKKK